VGRGRDWTGWRSTLGNDGRETDECMGDRIEEEATKLTRKSHTYAALYCTLHGISLFDPDTRRSHKLVNHAGLLVFANLALLLQDDGGYTRPRHLEQRLSIRHLGHIPKQNLLDGPSIIRQLESWGPSRSSVVRTVILVHSEDEDFVFSRVVGIVDCPTGEVVAVYPGVG